MNYTMVNKKKFISNRSVLTNSAKFNATLLKIEYLKGYIEGIQLAKQSITNYEADKLYDILDFNIEISQRQIRKYKDKLSEGK